MEQKVKVYACYPAPVTGLASNPFYIHLILSSVRVALLDKQSVSAPLHQGLENVDDRRIP